MGKIQLELHSTIECVCGQILREVSKKLPIKNNNQFIVTVTPCSFCQEEARSQAYNKGLEYGRKSKD